MPRDYKVFLQDAVEAIDNVTEFVADMPFETFKADRKTLHAVVRNLEVIGEAVKAVPKKYASATHRFPGSALPDCATS